MRIALWGAFDVEDCGRLAAARVLQAELRRRLPGAEVTVFAPLGRLRPMPHDGGRPAEPLAALDGAALATLGERFDCVLVHASDPLVAPGRAAQVWGDARAAALLHDPPDAASVGCPVVRIEPFGGEAGLPAGLLFQREADSGLLDRRTRFLRLMGWIWDEGRVLTIEGDVLMLDLVERLAAALRPLIEGGRIRVQLVTSSAIGGGAPFMEALEAALDGRCRTHPGVPAIEDLAAVVAGSTAYLGPAGAALGLAAAFGVPAAAAAGRDEGLFAQLEVGSTDPSGIAARLTTLLAPGAPSPDARADVVRLDARLDGIAAAVRAQVTPVGASRRPADDERLVRAHRARGRRLFTERRVLEAARQQAEVVLEAQLRESREESDRLRSELAAARAANDLIVGSRTWRYTQPVRDALARVRERRR